MFISVAFSPDGTKIVSSSANDPDKRWDPMILIWNVDEKSWPKELCRIAGRNFTKEEWQDYMGNRPYEQTCPQYPVHLSILEFWLIEAINEQTLSKVEESYSKVKGSAQEYTLKTPVIELWLKIINNALQQSKVALAKQMWLDSVLWENNFRNDQLDFEPWLNVMDTTAQQGEVQFANEMWQQIKALAKDVDGNKVDFELWLDAMDTTAQQGEAQFANEMWQQIKAWAKDVDGNKVDFELWLDAMDTTAQQGEAQFANEIWQQIKALAKDVDGNKVDFELWLDAMDATIQQEEIKLVNRMWRQIKVWGNEVDSNQLPLNEFKKAAYDFAKIGTPKTTNFIGELYTQLREWSIETSDADLNNGICWDGSRYGFAEEVFPACEWAVALAQNKVDAQENRENVKDEQYDLSSYRDSRGLALAHLGKFEEAIPDFKVFLNALQEEVIKNEQKIASRKDWIKKLKKEKILLQKKLWIGCVMVNLNLTL